MRSHESSPPTDRARGYELWVKLPRRVRRGANRVLARARAQRPAPVYVPADSQPVCEPHHRKLPCKRCTP
jgi:hypothetical protein